MRRLLLINQYFPPDASATANLLGDLTASLAEDHEVWVVVGRPSYTPDPRAKPPRGVRLKRVRSTSFDRSSMLGRLINYASFLAGAVVAGLSAPPPQVVLGFTDPPLAPLVGLLVAKLRRARFVYVCWDVYPDIAVALGHIKSRPLIAVWRVINGIARGHADRVVTVGRDMSEKLESDGVPPERLALIRHWSSVERPSQGSIAEARRRHEWGDRFVVMHAGNVGLAQNLGMLLEAATLLRDREDLRFVVLGDGAARGPLEQESRRRGLSNLQFLGQASRHEAQPILAAADLHFVSHAAGLRGTAVASKVYGLLALGLPFVAAMEEGSEIDRLASETGAGVCVVPGDVAGLAARIAEFADGNRDGAAAGRRGRAAFEASYQREHGIARYRLLLDELNGSEGGHWPVPLPSDSFKEPK